MSEVLAQIQGSDLVIDGHVIPYGEQVLRDNNLFLTDLGREIGLTDVVLTYDQRYFEHTLANVVVSSLETADPSIGWQILTELLPSPPEWILCFVMQKLSLRKLGSIISHDSFFLYLLKCAIELTQPTSHPLCPISAELYLSSQLKQTKTRVMLLYRTVVSGHGDFRNVVQNTVREYINEEVGQTGYLTSMATINTPTNRLFPQQEDLKSVNPNFLRRVITDVAAVSELVSSLEDAVRTKDERQFLGDRALYESILGQQCIRIVQTNLVDFMVEARYDLLIVIQLLSNYHGPLFWGNFLKDEETIQSFNRLMTHCILKGGQEWEEAVSLLEGLIKSGEAQFYPHLLDLFKQIDQDPTVAELELIRLFIIRCSCHLQLRQNHEFILFLTNYYFVLSKNVAQLHQKWIMTSHSINVGISSTLLCAYIKEYQNFLKLSIPDLIPRHNYAQPIKALLSVSKGRKGIAKGFRKTLLEAGQEYLQHQKEVIVKEAGRLSSKLSVRRFTKEDKMSFLSELSQALDE